MLARRAQFHQSVLVTHLSSYNGHFMGTVRALGHGFAASGADALILDLEDAVAPARKPIARAMVAEYLAAHAMPRRPEMQ